MMVASKAAGTARLQEEKDLEDLITRTSNGLGAGYETKRDVNDVSKALGQSDRAATT